MRRLSLPIAALLLFVAACGSPAPETPGQGVQAIIELYEARDFDALVRTRYAEISKAETDEQVETLIERFRTRFADEAVLQQGISVYESLSSKTPELTEDGTVATYSVEGGFVKLSKMPDGRWGFHL